MVSTRVLMARLVLVGFVRRSSTVSFVSARPSSRIVTAKVLLVSPRPKASTPFVSTKSPGARAVPFVAAKRTATTVFVAPVRSTVMMTLLVFSATLIAAVVKVTPATSLSVRVMVLVPRPRVVLVAALRRTWKVSFVSWLWLSVMSRVMMLVVSAGAKVRVPLVAV